MDLIPLCLHYDGMFTNSDGYVGGKLKLMSIDTQVKYMGLLQQVEERLPLKSPSGTLSLSYLVRCGTRYVLEDDEDVKTIFILHNKRRCTDGPLDLYVEWTSAGNNNMENSTGNKQMVSSADKDDENSMPPKGRPASKTPQERPSSPGNKSPAPAVEGGKDENFSLETVR